MAFDKKFLLLLHLFLLAGIVSSITLDELLSSYEWGVDSDKVNVSSVGYSNIDSDSNGRFDNIVFNLSVTANLDLSFSGHMGESAFEGSKAVSGNDNLLINFSSSDFEQGYYNFSYKIFDSNGDLLIDSYNNASYYFNSSLHEPQMVNISFVNYLQEDTDSDGLYEKLTCNISFDVNKTGDYKITLYLNKNQTYITADENISLTPGLYNKNISFSSKDIRKSRLNGTLTLDSIEITGNNVAFNKKYTINQSINIYSDEFDPQTSMTLGDFIDRGFDLDSDGLYDFMQLNFTTYFNQSSEFTLIGSLDDYYGQHVLDFNNSQPYTAGNQTVSIDLNGTEIWKKSINGPYRISYLKIKKDNDTFDLLLDAYMLLNATHYTHFDPLPKPDLTVSFSEIKELGNNYSTVKVKIYNAGERIALKALVEIYSNRTDLLDSRTAHFITENNYKILEFPRIYTRNTSELTAFVDINNDVDEENESNNMEKANTTAIINLNYNTTNGTAPLAVSFSATAEEGNFPFSFSWDFGDGTTSNSQNPEHTFSAGNYTVILTVRGRIGIERTAGVNITATPAPDTTPPSAVSGLTAQSTGETWIYWTWINPTDPDFSHCIVYLNDSNVINTTDSYYNATGLSEDTTYELGAETADTSNNINTSRITSTATTSATQDTTPPSTVTGLNMQSRGISWIFWTWTNPVDADFNSAIVYIDGSNLVNTSNSYYNATSLAPNTSYTITVRTKDNVGNMNTTDVNDTASTLETPNTSPTIAGLPDKNIAKGTWMNQDLIYLPDYASDAETASVDLNYTITDETNTGVVNCIIDSNNYLDCEAQDSNSGSSTVTIQVSDGELNDSDSLLVTVTNDDNKWWWIRDNTGSFDQMDVYFNGDYQGKWKRIDFGHEATDLSGWPTVAVIYSSGFMRLKPAISSVPNFGTSIVLGPSYWESNNYYHNPTIASIYINGDLTSENIDLALDGTLEKFNVQYNITLIEPYDDVMKADVTGYYEATDSISIDATRQSQKQGFKLTQFSSMYINDTYHDSDRAMYQQVDGSYEYSNYSVSGFDSFIYTNPAKLGSNRTVYAIHLDDDSWQGNTPNAEIRLNSGVIITDNTIQGYITNSADPNDDNVGLWINYDPASSFSSGDKNTITYSLLMQDDFTEPEELPDTTPPSAVNGLTAQSTGETWIYWTWINPTDPDFSHCIVYLNDSNVINTTDSYYNATGLSEDTTYELGAETADISNNINTSRIISTATTSATQDTTPPSTVTGLNMQSRGISWIFWTWINPTDPDFSHSILYLDSANIANTTDSYYNATGLSEDTTYELGAETADTSNNINTSRITSTASTLQNTTTNHDPVLTVNDIEVDEGDTITINPSSTDEDKDTVTYSYSGWMSSDTYTTNYDDSGTHDVTVTASDGRGGTDSETITITVNNILVPDLEISSLIYKPDNPSANTNIILRFIITNVGEKKANSVVWVIEDSNATVSEQQNTFDLNINEDMTVYALIKYPSSGNYNPVVRVDPSNLILEADEVNNEQSVSISIG